MKKIAISALVIVAFAAFVLYEKFSVPKEIPIDNKVTFPATSTKYKDGEFTGDVADAYFGKVQVKAVILGGKLTDVQFLDYPKDQKHSLEISQNSMPILKSEAIQSQSANVDIISGATQTAEAFKISLASALVKAL